MIQLESVLLTKLLGFQQRRSSPQCPDLPVMAPSKARRSQPRHPLDVIPKHCDDSLRAHSPHRLHYVQLRRCPAKGTMPPRSAENTERPAQRLVDRDPLNIGVSDAASIAIVPFFSVRVAETLFTVRIGIAIVELHFSIC